MKICIVGAGITGLTTALALHKLGFRCEVYERASELRAVGAGIWLQPNALKVLDWLGLGQSLREQGTLLNHVDITNAQLLPFKKTAPELITDKEGNKIVAIHRAALQKTLCEALPEGMLKLGRPLSSYRKEAGGLQVLLGEEEVQTDLLIGADGIHSSLRSLLFEKSNQRFSGQICWRAVANIKLPKEFQNRGIESWGKKIRFGFSQIQANQVYWFAVLNASENLSQQAEEALPQLQSHYESFHPLLGQILSQTEAKNCVCSELSDLKRLDTWHKGQVILLGDAAHATTPNMGQGAGQGIEDAYYLAHILAKNQDPAKAFALFEKSRREKVDYVVNNSWRFGKMAHSSWGAFLMKLLMKITPQSVMEKQLQKLYSIQSDF